MFALRLLGPVLMHSLPWPLGWACICHALSLGTAALHCLLVLFMLGTKEMVCVGVGRCQPAILRW